MPFVLLFQLVLLTSFQSSSNGHQGVWKVISVKNTKLELGTVKSSLKDFHKIRQRYIGDNFSIESNSLSFPEKLNEKDGYGKISNLVGQATFKKVTDNDAMKRWPGDELTCNYKSENTCLVSDSFMKLLGNSSNDLMVITYQSNNPNNFVARLCIIDNNLAGLLLDNYQVLLILKRIK
ncbi:hypothetical protein [Hymenobacter arizonensis]|uniref:Uncharacterized protein n=1 Tax=Hymenobacter arizonensis TaxID=1227077 RepID=A0A1I5UNI4_HYMAR|nr:hypothetical protein [Hymenobacter arizonensis]SFP96815.1 hypothetical protein SAMN04515668_1003 [Hymenobacter arizonensis]